MTVDEAIDRLFESVLGDIKADTLAAVLATASGKSLLEAKEAIKQCKKSATLDLEKFRDCVKKRLGLIPKFKYSDMEP